MTEIIVDLDILIPQDTILESLIPTLFGKFKDRVEDSTIFQLRDKKRDMIKKFERVHNAIETMSKHYNSHRTDTLDDLLNKSDVSVVKNLVVDLIDSFKKYMEIDDLLIQIESSTYTQSMTSIDIAFQVNRWSRVLKSKSVKVVHNIRSN